MRKIAFFLNLYQDAEEQDATIDVAKFFQDINLSSFDLEAKDIGIRISKNFFPHL